MILPRHRTDVGKHDDNRSPLQTVSVHETVNCGVLELYRLYYAFTYVR